METVEGIRLQVYKDSAGLDTIAVGHLLTDAEKAAGAIQIAGFPVPYAQGLTRGQVDALLGQDLLVAETVVNANITVPLTQGQFDALVSFVFNIGGGKFLRSTLFAELQSGNYADVPTQLRAYKYAGGKVDAGLINRREKEVALWLS